MSATAPTAAQRGLLERYLDELDLWTRRLNLTTVPRAAAWDRHVEEALALLAAAAPEPGDRVLDIGSGGGIPGVVVAIMRPDLDLTLLDADRRKAGFLVHVCGLFGLEKVEVVAERAETAARRPHHRRSYDLVVSRATAPPLRLVPLALPFLRGGGALVALVSPGDGAAAVEALAGSTEVAATLPAPGVLAVRGLRPA